jgi:hypothetical protein
MSEHHPEELEVETIEVSHQEFRTGLPAGRFRLIVNPDKARKYVRHRLLLVVLMLPLIGIGAALALSGYTWSGLILVGAGVLLHRLTGSHAANILLHLATQDERIYREAIEFEILEVRLAR